LGLLRSPDLDEEIRRRLMSRFEEYKLFSDRVQRLSERRQLTSQTYLAVNTAVLGVMAFLIRDAGLRGWGLVAVVLPLFLVGALACLTWLRVISDFRQIIGWQYEQLRGMEQGLRDSHSVYSREWEQFYKPRDGKERFGFPRLEAWLPRLFLGLYAVFFLGLTVATALGWF
jgi:hypothetical protein